ncbi:CO dehydrogenase maturation factor [Actinoplanes lutulentus]|uniref:CO dehydrogenase maturation factor n=1 Tax=Actinoplanes lutulentus TaxID=1287878 RepID=A0A327ZLH0_9ACTN|nr:ATP-binding protein [Actinoplanes lutulentus]MBB2940862.1 CO dehydrogenase maturation factor [Actinoplanes lutulentus]RAK43171.1 CO dehydrogenase maturation factor [Actinoplanes lutulentus]
MKIAFTGKGGSGKSTLAALFVGHLRATGQRVLAIDADVNVHLAPLLGVVAGAETALSHPDNVRRVRSHLLGSNPRVAGVEHFVATTPPGPGSHLVTLDETDPVLAGHATRLDDAAHVLHVGTYEAKDIGSGCYHGHLAILENLLSHVSLQAEDWVVCDMVAGTDAFANSLHAQFDVIVVVAEPTPESLSVARRYRELAEAAGVGDVVAVVGNKVADDTDRDYLARELGGEPLATLTNQAGLRRARQSGVPPRPADLDDDGALTAIAAHARGREMSGERRDALMRTLHLRMAQKGWVRSAHGDVSTQLAEV